MNFPIGMIALLVIGVLIYFGVAQRLLDRMRLNDRQAVIFIILMIMGSFLEFPLFQGGRIQVSVNVGGAVLPFLLSVWLIFTSDRGIEKIRAICASIMVALFIFLGSKYFPFEPETMFMDPKIIYGVGAGLIAYLIGRSRRSAFIGGVLGVILSDVVHLITLLRNNIVGTSALGGAGAFDVTIIAGLIAVMTAELVGETREKLQGGHRANNRIHKIQPMYEFSDELTELEQKEKADVVSIDQKRKTSSKLKEQGRRNNEND